ncbi:unnamed protein product, partial [Lampetra fluviatilis]
ARKGLLDQVKAKVEVCKEDSVDADQLRSYLEKRFDFEQVTVKKFRTWAERRQFHRDARRAQSESERPVLPSTQRLITLSLRSSPSATKRENPSEPFGASVLIDAVPYGSGTASSKKLAKNKAARSTLQILIPDFVTQKGEDKEPDDLEYFNHISIEDSRVYELTSKAGLLSPYQILNECLKRNHGMADTNIEFQVIPGKNQKSEFVMSCGKHSVRGLCKNKRVGKQLASQQVLQLLHPHVQTWGSLLRMYGRDSAKHVTQEVADRSVLDLQQFSRKNKPNLHILNRLRDEMHKLAQRR